MAGPVQTALQDNRGQQVQQPQRIGMGIQQRAPQANEADGQGAAAREARSMSDRAAQSMPHIPKKKKAEAERSDQTASSSEMRLLRLPVDQRAAQCMPFVPSKRKSQAALSDQTAVDEQSMQASRPRRPRQEPGFYKE